MKKELTINERLNRYEIAQETIGFMMAMRSSALWSEQKKETPDFEKIAKWDAELDAFALELHALEFDDDKTIQHVLDEYCPIVKSNCERMRAEQAYASM